MHTVSFSVSSTIEKQLRANLSWAFARLQHYDAELLDAVAVAAHRCVYGEVGVLGMAMEMGRWRFLQAFLFWRMMMKMMLTTGSHQAFSGGLRWFPHFGWKHPLHATSPWTLPGQELSSILWSFASFVVAPRADIVSDFCETLVQRTGSWGWWLHFHFQRFAGLIM